MWTYIFELHKSTFNDERFVRKAWLMMLHAWPSSPRACASWDSWRGLDSVALAAWISARTPSCAPAGPAAAGSSSGR